MTLSRPLSRAGFTLVELSIVLVVIGLLAGGVLGGQSLIRNAELKSIISDYTKYKAAAGEFKKQYGSFPGDIVDAQDFWGVCGPSTGACNGNGDGLLNMAGGASSQGESYQFWRQLALSGRIVGSFTGFSGPGSAVHTVPGSNAPAGRITSSGWEAGNATFFLDGTSYGASAFLDYGNFLRFGGATGNSSLNTPVLSPKDAWNIDTKLDDGNPGHGTVIASHWGTCTNASSNSDLTAGYKLTSTGSQCTLYFVQQF